VEALIGNSIRPDQQLIADMLADSRSIRLSPNDLSVPIWSVNHDLKIGCGRRVFLLHQNGAVRVEYDIGISLLFL
jgi:hypothetical protein